MAAKTTAQLTKEVAELKVRMDALWDLLWNSMNGDGRVAKAQRAVDKALAKVQGEG